MIRNPGVVKIDQGQILFAIAAGLLVIWGGVMYYWRLKKKEGKIMPKTEAPKAPEQPAPTFEQFNQFNKEQMYQQPPPFQQAQAFQHQQRPFETLFPHIRGLGFSNMDIESKRDMLSNLAQRLQQEQVQISTETDQYIESIEQGVIQMQGFKKQFLELAEVVDIQYQVLLFELETKQRILEYHKKNKARRANLDDEIKTDMNKAARTKM